jgi:hypothetical protein
MMDEFAVDKSLIEVPCSRTVAGDSFPAGVMDFNVNIGNPTVFKPSESYFRIACTVTAGTNQPSLSAHEVSLSDNFCGALFNQVSFRAGGQDVSSTQRYVAQGDQLRMRLSKSYAWQKSVGKNAFMIDADYESRRKVISYDDEIIAYRGEITIDAGGVVGGDETNFWGDGVRVGMILVVEGVKYPITGIVNGSATFLTVKLPTPFTPITTGKEYKVVTEEDRYTSSNGRNRVYVLWRPGIGIFDDAVALGAGNYTISLNPATNYKTAALQTLSSNTNSATYNLTIDDIRFYASTYKMEKPDMVEELTLHEVDVQSKVIGDSGNVSSLQFTVPPSTYGVAVFFQAGNAGYDSISPSTLFKTKQVYPPLSTTVDERSLQNIQISYGGMTRPQINWTNQEFTYDNTIAGATSTNELQQRYIDTISETGMLNNVGGVESFEDYLKRGLYVYYEFLKSESNKATDLQLSCNLASGLPADTRLFIAALYTKRVDITTAGGLVVQVSSKVV